MNDINTEIGLSKDFLGQIFSKDRQVSFQREPIFEDLKAIIAWTSKTNQESGLQIARSPDLSCKLTFTRDRDGFLRAPKLPDDPGDIIFFHTHARPEVPPSARREHSLVQFIPSYDFRHYKQTDGDHISTVGDGTIACGAERGGYLNIVTQDGLTLCVAVSSLTDDERFLRRTRLKQGKEDTSLLPILKVWSGPRAGESFTNIFDYMEGGEQLVDQRGIYLSLTDFYLAQTLGFLYLPWDTLLSTQISLEELVFKQGVNRLMQQLKIQDFPHEDYLGGVNARLIKK